MKGDSSKKRLSFAYTVVLLWGVYNVGNQFATMEDNSVDHSQPVEEGNFLCRKLGNSPTTRYLNDVIEQ